MHFFNSIYILFCDSFEFCRVLIYIDWKFKTFSDETFISVRNVAYGPNEEYKQVCGYAYQQFPETEPGKLLVQFPWNPFPGELWILDTDYQNYSAAYSCMEAQGKIRFSVWILTRNPKPSDEIVRFFYISRASR